MAMRNIGDIVSPDSEAEKDFELYIQMKLEYILMQNSRVEAILEAARKFIDTGDFDYFPWLEELSEDEEAGSGDKKKDAYEINKEEVHRLKDSEEEAFKMRNEKHDEEISDEQKKIKQDKAKAAYNLFDEANVEAVTNAVENAFIKKG